MQRTQTSQKRTAVKCEGHTRHTRHVTAMGCGDLFMVCCTFGAWLLVRALFAPRFYCDRCLE